jgi:hypothetical protein
MLLQGGLTQNVTIQYRDGRIFALLLWRLLMSRTQPYTIASIADLIRGNRQPKWLRIHSYREEPPPFNSRKKFDT